LPVIFSAASAPAVGIIDRVLGRNRAVLEQISSELAWPMQRDRVIAAARGLYRGNPGIPTWAGFKQSVRLDVSFPPPWMAFVEPSRDSGADGSDHLGASVRSIETL
jgi:hypothetical protein